MNIGEEIRRQRKIRKMSIEKLSLETDVSFSTIAFTEQGRTDPRLSTVNRILEAMGLRLVIEKEGWKPYIEGDEIPNGKYLVQCTDGEMYTGAMTNFGWIFGYHVPEIVAYRPLPERYKEKRYEQKK